MSVSRPPAAELWRSTANGFVDSEEGLSCDWLPSYDIHGNLPALEAVLHEIRQADIDEIVVGGDVVPGPMPRETLDCLLDLDIPVQFIQGNGDREVLAEMAGTDTGAVPERFREVMRWVAQQLLPEHERLLAGWLLLGPNIHLRHTSYDLAKAAERIRDSNYPEAHEFAAHNILQPPSEKEMLGVFAGSEVR